MSQIRFSDTKSLDSQLTQLTVWRDDASISDLYVGGLSIWAGLIATLGENILFGTLGIILSLVLVVASFIFLIVMFGRALGFSVPNTNGLLIKRGFSNASSHASLCTRNLTTMDLLPCM